MTYDPQHALMLGIFAKWLATSSLTGIGSLYRWEAPTNRSAHPYVILRDEPAQDGGMSCESQIFEHDLEFRAYDKTPELCSVHANKIDQVFSSDALSLTLSSLTLVSCRLVRPSYVQQDSGVWYAGLGYFIRTCRDRIA